MQKTNILIVILFQITFGTIYSQQSKINNFQLKDSVYTEKQSIISESTLTKFNSQITFGMCELVGISTGYIVNNKNILMLRLSLGVIYSPASGFAFFPNTGNTIGFKYIHIFMKDGFFNALNFGIAAFYDIDASYSSYPIDTFFKGYMIEATIGKKKQVAELSKIEFIYEIGGFVTKLKGHEIRFWPSIKLGMNFNF